MAGMGRRLILYFGSYDDFLAFVAQHERRLSARPTDPKQARSERAGTGSNRGRSEAGDEIVMKRVCELEHVHDDLDLDYGSVTYETAPGYRRATADSPDQWEAWQALPNATKRRSKFRPEDLGPPRAAIAGGRR